MNSYSPLLISAQDREAEPRFGPPGGAARGGFNGGIGGPGGAPGGYGGPGFNPAMAGGPGGGGGGGGGPGRQIYISNVCYMVPPFPMSYLHVLTRSSCPTPLAGKT